MPGEATNGTIAVCRSTLIDFPPFHSKPAIKVLTCGRKWCLSDSSDGRWFCQWQAYVHVSRLLGSPWPGPETKRKSLNAGADQRSVDFRPLDSTPPSTTFHSRQQNDGKKRGKTVKLEMRRCTWHLPRNSSCWCHIYPPVASRSVSFENSIVLNGLLTA